MQKMRYMCTREHYSVIREDEVLPFVMTWIGLENVMLSEINQTENIKNYMISLMCEI